MFHYIASFFLDSNPGQLNVFEASKDENLVNLLDTGLNTIPTSEQKFCAMSEQEFNTWLKSLSLYNSRSQKYKLHKPALKEANKGPTKAIILPLSIENNATITGTAAVLEKFGKEFKIPCAHAKVALPFDESKKTFDIEGARKHHEFLYLLQEHKKEMIPLKESLTSIEKQLPDIEGESGEEEIDDEESSDNSHGGGETFQNIDGKFKKIYNKLIDRMWHANQSLDAAAVVEFRQYLQTNCHLWDNATDHHDSTILHHAVQKGDEKWFNCCWRISPIAMTGSILQYQDQNKLQRSWGLVTLAL